MKIPELQSLVAIIDTEHGRFCFSRKWLACSLSASVEYHGALSHAMLTIVVL